MRASRNPALQLMRLEARTIGVRGTNRVLRALYDPNRRADDYVDDVDCYTGCYFQIDTRSHFEWNLYAHGKYGFGEV
jgi:hypothetical protein